MSATERGRDREHELLCAWLLGEASEEDARAVERALAGSAELRAEKERLEGTIALVRGAYGGSEALSEDAMEELMRAAEEGAGGSSLRPAGGPGSWLRAPALRAAAAVTAVLGGTLGVLHLSRSHSAGTADTVAHAPAGSAFRKDTGLDGELASRRGSEVETLELQAAAEVDADRNALASDTAEPAPAAVPPAEPAPEPQREALRQLSGDPVAAARADERSQVVLRARVGDEVGGKEAPAVRDAPGARENEQADAAASDDFFLGLGHGVDHGEGSEEERSKREYRRAGERAADVGAVGAVAGVPGAAPDLAKGRTGVRVRGEAAETAPEDLDDLGRLGGRLTGAEADRLAPIVAERYLEDCRRRPRETPRDMFFRYWGDNPFEDAARDPVATFAVDVDTASYALARSYLREGHLPPKAQVRTEEFLNYFDPDLPAPVEETFAVTAELAPSLFGGGEDRWMLRVGVRAKEVASGERAPVALTFVVDTSGSMREDERLELVKHAMRLLVGELDGRDSIAIVAFSDEARLVLPMTSAAQRGVIEAAIHPLSPKGSTGAEAGLKLGYEVALAALTAGVHNRVVLLSDGVANVGQTDQDRIAADVARHRAAGVYLNTIGVGMGNHNDVFLEQLADKGDGICDYVDDPAAARRAIVERFTGALVPIASDVKVQVELDPAQVARYRLLGYENRAVADRDFRNDAVDAGEVGAGHQVVALFELERAGGEPDGPLATVRLRWKEPKAARVDPREQEVTEIERALHAREAYGSFTAASAGYRRSVLVAQFAELLRRSVHARGDSIALLEREAVALAAELRDPDFDELVDLVRRAVALGLTAGPDGRDELELTIEEYKRHLYLRARLEELERGSELEELRRVNDELEQRIRDLVRRGLERR